jgi:DNA polymerase/3'-5' exonuclease PolX
MLAEELADDNPELDFHFGGSWRRGAPVIGDLDILVTSEDPISATLMSPGVILPSAVRWQRTGPRIANGELDLQDGPLHLDVWQAASRSRGAMLSSLPDRCNSTSFSGNAKARGLAVSQNALAERVTGQQVGDGTESSIYEILGMAFL